MTDLETCRRPSWLGRAAAWYSGRLFPDAAAVGGSCRRTRVAELLLVVATGLLFFTRLDVPLQEPEETLYAEVPRQMMAADRVLVPVRHGQDYYDKPPLLYWLVMAVYHVCGVHDWAARLVPSGAGFLCVLLCYAWGKRTAGPRAAFAAAVMLALAPRFTQMSRMLTTNALLTLWVGATLAAGQLALAGPPLRRGWWLLSALACAMGILTKGPVALALAAGPLALYQVLDRRSARAGWRAWSVYVVVAMGLSLPWFIAVAVRDPAFLDYFLWTHHVRRFLDPIDHPQPFWYYLPLLFLGMLPWSLLLPGMVRLLAERGPAPRPARTGALGFFLIVAVWGFAFFSASGCKRPSYILPVMPPLALALGAYLDAAWRAGRLRLVPWAVTAAAMFVVLLGAVEFLLPAYAHKYSLRDQVTPHEAAHADAVPVLCYPHGWDAVSFYLQRSDVHVFRRGQLDELVAVLERQPRSLVVVKADQSLDDFRAALPARLEFVPSSREPTAVVGWVRHR